MHPQPWFFLGLCSVSLAVGLPQDPPDEGPGLALVSAPRSREVLLSTKRVYVVGDPASREWKLAVKLLEKELNWEVVEKTESADVLYFSSTLPAWDYLTYRDMMKAPVPTVAPGEIPEPGPMPERTDQRVVAILTNADPPEVVRLVRTHTRVPIDRDVIRAVARDLKKWRKQDPSD